MLAGIMLFVMVVILISIFASTRMVDTTNACFGVSLPKETLKNDEIAAVVKRYRRTTNTLIIVFAIAGIPLFFVLSYESITILYLFVWIGALLFAVSRIFAQHRQKLMNLKIKHHWFSSTAKIVTVDTEVSRLKNTMPVSRYWFILPIALSLLPFLFALLDTTSPTLLLSLGGSSFVSTAISYWMYTLVCKERTSIYSENTAVNIAYNTIRIRTLSLGWLFFAMLETVSMTIISLIVWQADGYSGLFPVAIGLTSILGLALIIGAYRQVRLKQQKLRDTENNLIYTDENDEGQNGLLFYNNPNDTRIFVEKKIGYGYTLNLATKTGKTLTYGLICIVILTVVGLTAFSFVMDFGKMELVIANDIVEMHAPVYSYQFDVKDIRSITLIDTLPKGIRTNGASTERYSIGYFDLNGYGKSRLFIIGPSPYIVIKLDDLYVFLNGETMEQTQDYYNQLQNIAAP